MKKLIFACLAFGCVQGYSQEAIEVTDQTIKVPGLEEQTMYYAFAEGDKIIFSFSEEKEKELKEVEIIEYPSVSKFMDYKTSKIENKTLNVLRTGVYKFRFYNGNIAGRICKVKIQRIPLSDQTKFFNTSIKWVEKQDTTWNTYTKDVIIGYDTNYQQKTKIELVKTEQKEEIIFDKIQRVHSGTNLSNENYTWLFFSLPANENGILKTKKVISWAYWIGVDDAGNKAWEQNARTISNLVKGAAPIFFTPLGALAAGAVTELFLPSIGEDVSYWLSDEQGKNAYVAGSTFNCWDRGKGIAGYKKFTDEGLCQGKYFIILHNDNFKQGVNATVKVVAITETKIYENKIYQEQKTTPKYQKQIFKDPIISKKTIPVILN